MAEIQRSPVELGSLSHYLQGFSTIPGGDRQISAISSITCVGGWQIGSVDDIIALYTAYIFLQYTDYHTQSVH